MRTEKIIRETLRLVFFAKYNVNDGMEDEEDMLRNKRCVKIFS
jgi:hypothetical protein